MNPKIMIRSRIALLILTGFFFSQSSFASDSDKREVEKAVAEFYIALNAMFLGDLSPMKTIWSHAEDVTYLPPDGSFQVGWKNVLKDWEKQAAMKLGGKVSSENMKIFVGKEIAVVQNFEKGENVDPQGNPLSVSIRATNLFRKEGGKWKMIGHHTDKLPFLEK